MILATAISYGNSDGTVGRCDAKCHEATKPDCDCICGGRLHGSGSSAAAIEQLTEDFFGPELLAELKRLGIDGAQPAMKGLTQ